MLRFWLLAGLLSWAVTADATQITFNVTQHAETDGSLNYAVNFRPGGLPPTATLVAPDGSIAKLIDPIRENGLTYEQLSTRFFGEWTIQDDAPSTDVYHFTLANLPQLPVPVVSSPAAGEVLGPAIHVAWTFPGSPLPGPGISAGSLDPVSFTFDTSGGPNQATVLVDLAGLPSAQVSVRGGGGYSILDFISPDMHPAPEAPHWITGNYTSYSAPVTVTVVPEPGSAALAGLGCLAVIASGWKRLRKPGKSRVR
jgi:hypothetical protein